MTDKEIKISRVCKTALYTINKASDIDNIVIYITLTLDLDPDINMFDAITRTPSKYFSEDEFSDFG